MARTAEAISSSIMPKPPGRLSSFLMGGILNMSRRRNKRKPVITNFTLIGMKRNTKNIEENSSITTWRGSLPEKCSFARPDDQNPDIKRSVVTKIYIKISALSRIQKGKAARLASVPGATGE